VKFAKGANGALAALGIAIEVWDSWEQYKREEAFRGSIAKMVENFEQQRKELLGLISSEQFREQFFGKYLELKSSVAVLEDSLRDSHERQQRFQAWRVEAEAIDAEFKSVN
jgi:hypothetical protein